LQEEIAKQTHSVSPTTKRLSNFHAATDDKRNRNLHRSQSSQSLKSELRIDDESQKDEKQIVGFQLNLK
jgi:hypothetical protein